MRNPILPAVLLVLAALAAPAAAQTTGVQTEGESRSPEWISFNDALSRGEADGKIVLIDVMSPRCGWCTKMQREVYTRADLVDYVNEHFVTGRLNIDVRDDKVDYMGYSLSSAELSAGFGARGTPTTVFLMPDGSYITRLPGYVDYDAYFPVLRFIATESFRDMSFEEFMEKNGQTDGDD